MNKISLWKSYSSIEGNIFRILQPTLKKRKERLWSEKSNFLKFIYLWYQGHPQLLI